LNDVLRRPEFLLIAGAGEYAGVGAGQVPDASRLPVRVVGSGGGYGHLRALIGKRVIEFPAQHHAKVARVNSQGELRGRFSGAAAIRLGRVNLNLPAYR
jgi:hypothetical protein